MDKPARRARSTAFRIARALTLLAAAAAACGAQGLTGVVRDSATRQPIAGAVLTIRDSAGTALMRRLTNARGEYGVDAVAGGRTIRVVRIGYEPRDVPVPPRAEPGARLEIVLLALPSMLRPIRVVANSQCPIRKDAGVAMGLWEQARAGLLANVVAREQNPASIFRLLSLQAMDGNSDRIETMRVRADSSVDTISFVAARSAREFVRSGFRHDSAGVRATFGPDALVLLSDEFAAAYCFRVADGSRARPHETGIRFVPATQSAQRTDIDGTLWIDTVARELRDVEYLYLGMPGHEEAFRPGGRVSFRAMPNGVVLVERWSIRSVGVATDTVWTTAGAPALPSGGARRRGAGIGDPGGGAVTQRTLRGREIATVTGGELARAAWPDGTVWRAPLGTLRVRLATARGTPVANALVSLTGTPYFALTGSNGTAELVDLVPGPYEIREVADARLAEIGIATGAPLRIAAVRDSTVSVSLTVATAESMAAARCASAAKRTAADTVFLLGQVITADGRPLADGRLTFATKDDSAPRWHAEEARTAGNGVFVSCRGWRVGDTAIIRVNQPGAHDFDVTRTIESSLLVVRIALDP